MVKTAWQMITAGVLFNTVAIFNGEYANFNFANVATEDWLAMAYLDNFWLYSCFRIICLVVAISSSCGSFQHMRMLNPIVAVALSYFLDDVVTHLQIYGLAVILFSVLLMNLESL